MSCCDAAGGHRRRAPADEAIQRGRGVPPARRRVPQLPRRARRQAGAAGRGHQPRHRRRRRCVWRRTPCSTCGSATTPAEGDRSAARAELLADRAVASGAGTSDLATSLADRRGARPARRTTTVADARFVDAVRHDLRGRDGNATATAVRMIWTGDHLDAARGMQALLREPAHTAAEADALSMFARMRPWRPR